MREACWVMREACVQAAFFYFFLSAVCFFVSVNIVIGHSSRPRSTLTTPMPVPMGSVHPQIIAKPSCRSCCKGCSVLIENNFLSKFPDFFFAQFFVFPYFPFFFPFIGTRSLPNILPSVKFPNFEMFAVFPAFPVFLGEKKRKNWKKKSCSIRTALSRSELVQQGAATCF